MVNHELVRATTHDHLDIHSALGCGSERVKHGIIRHQVRGHYPQSAGGGVEQMVEGPQVVFVRKTRAGGDNLRGDTPVIFNLFGGEITQIFLSGLSGLGVPVGGENDVQ